MAEVFGAVAGVFGVVSLSMQLAESIQKVKSFRANFKQACPRLADLVEEIEETCDLMIELEHEVQDTGVVTSLLMYRCMNSSRKAVEYFARVTRELETYAKRRRIRGGLRYALSQDDVARMLSRMERAKGLLAMAYTQYLGSVQQQQYDIMIRSLERLTLGQQDIIQRMDSASVCQLRRFAESAAIRTDCGKKFMRIFEVRTPNWMSKKIWQLALDRSTIGWQFTMRTYGVVSRHDHIVKACQNSDTVAMQRLFDTGAASPFDQTAEGFDLVSVSYHLAPRCWEIIITARLTCL